MHIFKTLMKTIYHGMYRNMGATYCNIPKYCYIYRDSPTIEQSEEKILSDHELTQCYMHAPVPNCKSSKYHFIFNFVIVCQFLMAPNCRLYLVHGFQTFPEPLNAATNIFNKTMTKSSNFYLHSIMALYPKVLKYWEISSS